MPSRCANANAGVLCAWVSSCTVSGFLPDGAAALGVRCLLLVGRQNVPYLADKAFDLARVLQVVLPQALLGVVVKLARRLHEDPRHVVGRLAQARAHQHLRQLRRSRLRAYASNTHIELLRLSTLAGYRPHSWDMVRLNRASNIRAQ